MARTSEWHNLEDVQYRSPDPISSHIHDIVQEMFGWPVSSGHPTYRLIKNLICQAINSKRAFNPASDDTARSSYFVIRLLSVVVESPQTFFLCSYWPSMIGRWGSFAHQVGPLPSDTQLGWFPPLAFAYVDLPARNSSLLIHQFKPTATSPLILSSFSLEHSDLRLRIFMLVAWAIHLSSWFYITI